MLACAPLQPFGAEVFHDLREPLAPAGQAALRELLWEHQVLVFRDQELTHPQQIAVMEAIAPVMRTAEGAHYISTEREKGVLGKLELPFHSDLSFVAKPRQALSLHAVDVVYDKTSTRFVSGLRAAAALPPELRARLAGLTALHVFPCGDYSAPSYEGELPAWLPRHAHPVLMPHPVTGAPILYVTELQTARIEGLEPEESRALIAELQARLYAPENRFEHFWRNGDLVIWDNLATQHARGALTDAGPRTLQKVQTGTESFAEQWPNYSAAELQAELAAQAVGQ